MCRDGRLPPGRTTGRRGLRLRGAPWRPEPRGRKGWARKRRAWRKRYQRTGQAPCFQRQARPEPVSQRGKRRAPAPQERGWRQERKRRVPSAPQRVRQQQARPGPARQQRAPRPQRPQAGLRAPGLRAQVQQPGPARLRQEPWLQRQERQDGERVQPGAARPASQPVMRSVPRWRAVLRQRPVRRVPPALLLPAQTRAASPSPPRPAWSGHG